MTMLKKVGQRIIKWLAIISFALFIFTLLLVGLGYLLKENERKTTILKNKLDEERSIRQSRQLTKEHLNNPIILTKDLGTPLPTQRYSNNTVNDEGNEKVLSTNNNNIDKEIIEYKQIIIDHLMCTSTQQCKLFDTGRIELGCVVAVNNIGYSLLSKKVELSRSPFCEEQVSELSKSCHRNICSVQ